MRVSGGTTQVAKIMPAASPPVVLAKAAEPVIDQYTTTAWSPSGEWILYPTGDGFSLISPDGESGRKLTSRKFLAYGFSKDGGQLLGIQRATNAKEPDWQLFAIDVNTGAEKFLAPVELPASTANVASFSLHPDGKRFLTSIAKWPYEIWMLEGFDDRNTWFSRLFGR